MCDWSSLYWVDTGNGFKDCMRPNQTVWQAKSSKHAGVTHDSWHSRHPDSPFVQPVQDWASTCWHGSAWTWTGPSSAKSSHRTLQLPGVALRIARRSYNFAKTRTRCSAKITMCHVVDHHWHTKTLFIDQTHIGVLSLSLSNMRPLSSRSIQLKWNLFRRCQGWTSMDQNSLWGSMKLVERGLKRLNIGAAFVSTCQYVMQSIA